MWILSEHIVILHTAVICLCYYNQKLIIHSHYTDALVSIDKHVHLIMSPFLRMKWDRSCIANEIPMTYRYTHIFTNTEQTHLYKYHSISNIKITKSLERKSSNIMEEDETCRVWCFGQAFERIVGLKWIYP